MESQICSISDGLLLQLSAWNPQAVRVAHSSRVYITWGWGEARGGIRPNDRIRPRPRTAAISLSGNPGLQKPHSKSACSRADGSSRSGWANTHRWGRNSPVPLTQQKRETEPSLRRAGALNWCLGCVIRKRDQRETQSGDVWTWVTLQTARRQMI